MKMAHMREELPKEGVSSFFGCCDVCQSAITRSGLRVSRFWLSNNHLIISCFGSRASCERQK